MIVKPTSKPRAYTPEEARTKLLDHIRIMRDYWATVPGTTEYKLDGLCFSILNIFDGTTTSLPGMDIVLRPHPEDEAFCTENNENFFEDGQIINQCFLHNEWFPKDTSE